MVDIVSNPTPQPVAVDGVAASGKQAASPDSSFSNVLSAAVAGEQGTQDSAVPKAEAAAAKPKDGEAAVSDLAGAVQVAMALPIQQNVAAVVQEVPQIAADPAVAPVSADAVQPQQESVQPTVAQATPQSATFVPTAAVQAVVKPDSGKVAAEAQSVPTEAAPAVAPNAVSTLGQPTVADQPTAGSEPIQGAATPKVDSTAVKADAPAQANAPVQPVVAEAQNDLPVGVKSVKSDKPIAPGAQPARTTIEAQTRVPVETVPVEWRFDGSSQRPVTVTGQAAVMETLVQSISGSSTKPAGGESGSASEQGSPNPQGAVPMGLQFNAQLGHATQTAPVATSPDLPTRVIDQVVREVKLSQIDGRSNLVVKLNPPDLGALRLQISQDASGMTTHIQAANSQVRGLLEANMPLLMDSLSKAGVQMDSVSVSVGTSFGAFAQNARQQDAQPNGNYARQQFASSRGIGGVQAVGDAPSPAWARAEQIGHSWLA